MVNNFVLRAISGAVLVVVVVGAILWSPLSMAALAVVIAGFSSYEFFAISDKQKAVPAVGYSLFASLATVILFYLVAIEVLDTRFLLTIVPLYSLLFFIELFRNKKDPFGNIAMALCALFYIALPMGLFVYLPFVQGEGYNAWLLLSMIFTVWANDVGAYLVGVSIGRHKMFERLSPKKSWEGFCGGVFFAVLASCLIARQMGFDICLWAGMGLLISLTSVLGDLVESMLKRSLKIKDSGNIIPGHGGFLDRFDALLLSVPYVFIYFIIFTLK